MALACTASASSWHLGRPADVHRPGAVSATSKYLALKCTLLDDLGASHSVNLLSIPVTPPDSNRMTTSRLGGMPSRPVENCASNSIGCARPCNPSAATSGSAARSDQ